MGHNWPTDTPHCATDDRKQHAMPDQDAPTATTAANDAVPYQVAHPHAYADPYTTTTHQDPYPHEAAPAAEHQQRPAATAQQLNHIVVLIRAAEYAFQQLNDAVRAANITFGDLNDLHDLIDDRRRGTRRASDTVGFHGKRHRSRGAGR